MKRWRSLIGAVLMLAAIPVAVVVVFAERIKAWRLRRAEQRRAAQRRESIRRIHQMVDEQRIQALHGEDREIPLEKKQRPNA